MNFEKGKIQTFVGTGERGYAGDGGPATSALLSEPFMCAFDAQGNLFLAEATNHCIRRVDKATGVITTVAGTGGEGYSGDGGPAIAAAILGARAVCNDGKGNTYICEREGNGVRMVDTLGRMSTIAGTGDGGYTGDGGPALNSTWGAPKAIRCDRQGNLLVVDTENHAIRRIDAASRTVTTVAGGHKGGDGDGGDAVSAGMDRPHGADVDAQGNIYIADSNNHRVRVVGV